MSYRKAGRKQTVLLLSLLGVLLWGTSGCTLYRIVKSEEQVYTKLQPKKAHHTKKGFMNPGNPQPKSSAAFDIFRIITGATGQERAPATRVSKKYKAQKRYLENNSLTWIGHSAFQIRLKGVNILADPILSNRASPFRFAGPRRMQKPGLTLKEIGKVDVIIISHNHYDHLDRDTIQRFSNKAKIDVLVPLGVGSIFRKMGYKKVREMDWWDTVNIRGIRFTCYPVQHFSGRGLADRNKTLWAGWGVTSPDMNIFFAGDSGYFSGFKKIGKKDGPFDIALVPIGAYEPNRSFHVVHMNPKEAIQTAIDLKAKRAVGMHWGTFPLSIEHPKSGKELFLQAAKKTQFGVKNAWLMKVGETRKLPMRTNQSKNPATPPKKP